VPETAIEAIRALVGADDLQHDDSGVFQPGDRVELAGNALHGLEAVITQVLPGQQRVAVLMDFLGRQTTVEVGVTSITKQIYR
jgi:transcription antitermination factor NusG